ADCQSRQLKQNATDTGSKTGLIIGNTSSVVFLAELQVWSIARVGQDIRRTMNQPAVARQEGLQGYYRFNDGSGHRAADTSGNAADAQIQNSQGTQIDTGWSVFGNPDGPTQPVPICDEAPEIVTISNGYISDEATNLNISYTPSVVEDRPSQNRIYTYLTTEGELLLQANVPLAETELVYLGQMQYKPRLIGFIEGAPPVPSENLTVDSSGTPDRYLNNTSIQLNRSDNANVSTDTNLVGSHGTDSEKKSAVDISGEATVELGDYEGVALAGGFEGGSAPVIEGKGNINVTDSNSRDTNRSYSKNAELNNTVNKSFALGLGGGWENNCYTIPGDIVNKRILAGQRLFRPNNMGSAIVKSRTADLYAVRSKKTQAMLGYKVIPNPEIPEDINILMFKINPQYIKNGTLDGYIGFDKDIDYNNLAAGRKGSFFKPEEAYRLKST
ncbi:MAG: hypothetical protein D3922_13155, partial [Candidatus Electrothrix sp. AR1]|nr:hypothetical protein [Candidatus Electrothrix sp. AR1]